MIIHRKQQLIYIITDVISAIFVWIAFLLFRWLVYDGFQFGIETTLIPAFSFWPPLCIYPIGCLLVYYLSGYYLRPFHKSLATELIITLISSIIVALGAFFIIIIDDHVTDYSRYIGSLLVLLGLQFGLCYIPRLCITLYSRRHHAAEPRVLIRQEDYKDENELYQRIAQEYPKGQPIDVEPRIHDILIGAARIGELEESPYIRITEVQMTDAGRCIKRVSDVVIAAIMIVVCTPLWIILGILVKTSSPGPVLYKQERIGLYGRPFVILKFRSMYHHTEEATPQLTADDDPRITPIGLILRKYRLDELPQLFNILKGEMSLVGPRPERQFFINQIMERAPYYCLLYKIRPGLTSWGPIKVGYTDTIDKMIERLKYDIAYTENMSLRLDLKILFYTIGLIVKGRGK